MPDVETVEEVELTDADLEASFDEVALDTPAATEVVVDAAATEVAAEADNKPAAEDRSALEVRTAELQASEEAGTTFWSAMLEKHPDAAEITDGQEFQLWLADQPPLIRKQCTEGNVEMCLSALDQFKADSIDTAKKPTAEVVPFDASTLFDGVKERLIKSTDDDGNEIEIPISDVVDQFPELPALMTVMLEAYHASAGGAVPAAAASVAPEGMLTAAEAQQLINQAVEPLRFSTAVLTKHPDFEVLKSDVAFDAWRKEKGPLVERIWKEGLEGSDSASIVDVLDAYRMDGKKTQQRNNHQKKNDLHGASIRKTQELETGSDVSAQDLETAFAEVAKSDE